MIHAAAESMVLTVADLSMVGEARRSAQMLAADLGFAERRSGNLAIVVTEAATNLAQHAPGGQLILQGLRQDDEAWVELLTIDRGPGMADVNRCIADGYSTLGTAGQGLGAIRRLSDLFEIYSMAGVGTALWARVYSSAEAAGRQASGLQVGVVSVPKPGERYSGDGWAVSVQPERSLFMVVDGLGHGPAASEAAMEARQAFVDSLSGSLGEIMDAAHGSLRKTRGAAMAVAEVRVDQRLVRFMGAGNISAVIWSAANPRSMVSANGIVGHGVRRFQEYSYPFPQDSILAMYSDGLTSHVRLDIAPGLPTRHPGVIAGMLYRDFVRGRDDATVLVARQALTTELAR